MMMASEDEDSDDENNNSNEHLGGAYRIRSAHLRVFVQFYSALGYQLTPIPFQSRNGASLRRNLLNFALLMSNISFLFASIYTILVIDPYDVNGIITEIDKSYKPLMGNVIRLNMFAVYSICRIISLLHFMFEGRKLICLLDCDYLRAAHEQVASRRPKPLCALIAIQSLFIACYMLMDEPQLYFNFFSPNSRRTFAEACLIIWTSISLYFDIYVLYLVVWYWKSGTIEALRHLATRRRLIDFDDLRRIAIANRRMHSLLSLPITSLIVGTILDCVCYTCMMLGGIQPTSLGSYFGMLLLGALHFAHLESTTQRCLTSLFRRFEQQQWFHLRAQISSPFSPHLRRLFAQELNIYRRYFRLRIFEMLIIDYAFILRCASLVFYYSVITIQTSL